MRPERVVHRQTLTTRRRLAARVPSVIPRAAPWWPLAAALVILGALVAIFLAMALRLTGGGFAYALDDAYIHQALARSLAFSGEWGLGGHAFAGASSSPLWTILLALATRVAGDHALTPLVLNLASAALLLAVAHVVLARRGLPSVAILLVLAMLVVAVPLAPLVLSGMEHVLQAALALAFAALAAEALASGAPTRAQRAWLMVLAPLLVGVRYEDAVLVGVVAVAAWIRGQRGLAVGMLALGAAPAVVYGAFSMAHGWPFLPTSLIAKAVPLREPFDALVIAVGTLFGLEGARHVLVLVLAALVLVVTRRKDRPASPSDILIATFAATACLHFVLGRAGWFFRYDAYLVALGIVAIAATLHERRPWPVRPWRAHASRVAALAAITILVAFPVATRALEAHDHTPRAIADIHNQHLLVARFLDENYPGRGVALNDIGAVSYFADVRIVDLWGVSDQEMARAWHERAVTTALVRERALAGNASVGVLYDSLFLQVGGLPPEWVAVGRWTLAERVVAAGDAVTFYAMNPDEAPRLRAALEGFAPRLPAGVAYAPTP